MKTFWLFIRWRCRWVRATMSIARWKSLPHLVAGGALVCTGIVIVAPVLIGPPPAAPPAAIPVTPLYVPLAPPPSIFQPVIPIADIRRPFVLPPEDVRGYPPVIIEGSPWQFPPVVIEGPRMGPRTETDLPEPNSAVIIVAGAALLLLGGSLLSVVRGAIRGAMGGCKKIDTVRVAIAKAEMV